MGQMGAILGHILTLPHPSCQPGQIFVVQNGLYMCPAYSTTCLSSTSFSGGYFRPEKSILAKTIGCLCVVPETAEYAVVAHLGCWHQPRPPTLCSAMQWEAVDQCWTVQPLLLLLLLLPCRLWGPPQQSSSPGGRATTVNTFMQMAERMGVVLMF